MKIFSGTQSNYDAGVVSDERSWSASLECFYGGYWNYVPTECLKNFTLSDYATNGKNITMGDVLGGELKVNLMDISSDDLSLLKEGHKVRIKLTLENANVTLISKVFVIDTSKIKRRGATFNAEITAYDPTYKMTYTYVANAEKMTALQVVTQIANKYSLGVDASVSEAIAAVDGSTPHQFTMLADFTDKDTLGYMAGCYGCNASVNEEQNICFVWYENTDEEIRSDRIYMGGQYVSEMESRTIVMIETGTQDNPITYPSVATGHSINYENPYITEAQAQAIYNAKIANGKIKFNVGKTKYKGNPLNGSGKIVKVFDTENEEAIVYIMKRKLTYGGGLSETIECLGESETSTRYSISSPTQQRINRTLSKMEEAIKSATDAITQTKGSVFEFIPVDENDPTKGNAGYHLHYKDTDTNDFDDCLITATAGGIGFSTDGGQTYDGAAMYFVKDEATGEIHGAINGEFIRAGSISADKIDTSQLKVSKDNVTGLSDELDALAEIANGASATAGTASTTANEAKNALVNLCVENDLTLIDGANIYTGSIAANSIDVNKLSVGEGINKEMFYNSEFKTNTACWFGYGCTIKNHNDYIRATSLSGYTAIDVSQYVYLENGKKYCFAAQVLPLFVSEINSGAYVSVLVGSTYKNTSSYFSFNTSTIQTETVIQYYFDYTGTTGLVQVGVVFKNLIKSNGSSCDANIAWMSLSETRESKSGVYCSNKNWLASAYKETRYVPFSSNSTPYKKEKSLVIDSDGSLATLGNIKGNNGYVGALNFSNDEVNMQGFSSFGTEYVLQDKFSVTLPNYYSELPDLGDDVRDASSIRISIKLVTQQAEINTTTGNTGSFSELGSGEINSYGISFKQGSYNTYMYYNGINSTGNIVGKNIGASSSSKIKRDVSEKSSVVEMIKSSKIYEYYHKTDDEFKRKKTGFIIENETPKDVISDDGESVDLYSMASINWKATQEILDRLEAIEKVVNKNA